MTATTAKNKANRTDPPLTPQALIDKLDNVRATAKGWSARCPAHDDRTASLSVGVGDDGRILLRCHAGCETSAVVAALGLTLRDLMPRDDIPPPRPQYRPPTTYRTADAAVQSLAQRQGAPDWRWSYHDIHGQAVGVVVRWDRPDGRKDIRPVSRRGEGWVVGAMPTPRPLYGLPALADRGLVVVVVEGERCADAARSIGLTATTSAGGSQAAAHTDWSPLAGREVWVLPDNDAPGRVYAETVRGILSRLTPAPTVKVVTLPGLPDGGDIVDWIDAHGDAAEPDSMRAEIVALAAASSSGAAPEPERPRETIRNTDLGNAQRLRERHGADLRHCHPWGRDLIWDGMRWKEDDTGEAERRAKDTVRHMYVQAATESDETRRAALAQWAAKSESAARIHSMLSLVRSEPGIAILPDALDKDTWSLNCLNGTVDLRTGKLREHRREDCLTKVCPVAFDPDADCPVFRRVLLAMLRGDKELVNYVQRVAGYCATGSVAEQILLIFHGEGSNGKSTLINALLDVLGRDYAMKATADLLMANRGERHPTELADLFGKRLVITSETQQGRRLNEALVKDLTGGEPIRARRMREDFWQFNPTHKAILLTNHRPAVTGGDEGIWRRLCLVPFEVKFWNPDDPRDLGANLPSELRQDKALPEKLAAERSGILSWIVAGALEWQRIGLCPPAAVRAATSAYRAEEDRIAQWIAECCVTGPQEYRARSSTLYASYRRWAEMGGEHPASQTAWGKAMTDRKFTKFSSNGTWYLGIRMRDED